MPTNHKVDPWLKLLNGPQTYLVDPEGYGDFYDYSMMNHDQLPEHIIKMFENDNSELTQRLYLLCKAWTPLPKEDIAFRLGSLFTGNPDLGEVDKDFDWLTPCSKLFKLLVHHKAFREFISWKKLRVKDRMNYCWATIIQVQDHSRDLLRGKPARSPRVTRIVWDTTWSKMGYNGDIWHNTGDWPRAKSARDNSLDKNTEPFDLSDPSLLQLVNESGEESWPHQTMKWGPKKEWWLYHLEQDRALEETPAGN